MRPGSGKERRPRVPFVCHTGRHLVRAGVNPIPISQDEAESMLRKIAREHLEGKVPCEFYTKLGGEPGAVIVEAVKDLGADSVVIATHGRKGIGRLILGSVAERVVRLFCSNVEEGRQPHSQHTGDGKKSTRVDWSRRFSSRKHSGLAR